MIRTVRSDVGGTYNQVVLCMWTRYSTYTMVWILSYAVGLIVLDKTTFNILRISVILITAVLKICKEMPKDKYNV